MINVALSDDDVQILLGSFEAAVRQIGGQLQQTGLSGVEGAVSRLQAVLNLTLKLQTAIDATKVKPNKPAGADVSP